MPQTNVIIEYRTYVPSDWIAFTFCSVGFSGKDYNRWQYKWYNYIAEHMSEYNTKMDNLRCERDEIEKGIESYKNDFKKRPLFWRFTTKWQSIKNKIYELENELTHAKDEFSELYNGEAKERLEHAHEFLHANGFRCVSKASSGKCPRTYETWEL